MGWVRLLTDEIGPRRPTTAAERQATEAVRERLREQGVEAELREFPAYSSFGWPFGLALLIALAAPVLVPRRPVARWLGAAIGAGLLAAEDGLVHRPLSRLLARGRSQNLVAKIEPSDEPQRTACLVCHLDSSRSGLLFHPRFLPWLHPWLTAQGAALGIASGEALITHVPGGRALARAARGAIATDLALLAERELRGADVPGANDNASGVAAVATLACRLQREPLENTRVICLFTGSEEAGLLGADAFLSELEKGPRPPANSMAGAEREGAQRYERAWRSWLFINFDGVGAPATLRLLRREGVVRQWDADPRLVAIGEEIAANRPELGLQPTDRNAGLTYDTSPVLARGGRGVTLSAQDETIPNYHAPTDTAENLEPDVLERAIEVGREMLTAIDEGRAG